MPVNNTFNLKRLSQLLINDIRLHSKTMLIVAITLAVILALLPFHVTSSASAYLLILYIGGFIISSFAFNDLHNYRKAHWFLLLPCSNFERFFSKWLLTALGFPIATLAIYYLFSLLSVTVNGLIFKQQIILLNILQPEIWSNIGKYIILQALVLLGAITFKRYVLIKTILTLGCLFLAFSMFAILLSWMFCPDCSQQQSLISEVMQGGHFIFWIVIAPICWCLTYLRLRKYELQ